MEKPNIVAVLKFNPTKKKCIISEQIFSELITPFVGYQTIKSESTLVFGFFAGDTTMAYYAGSALPLENLIQAWRSAKFIRELDFITDDLLKEIWNVTKRIEAFPNLSRDLVVKACTDARAFEKLHVSIMNSYPSSEQLDQILKPLLKNNVAINLEEIDSEIKLTAAQKTDGYAELKTKYKIPEVVTSEERIRIINDDELDDLFEKFNKTSLIIAREINDPNKDYLEMYHDLEAQLSKEDALRQMYLFFKNLLSPNLKDKNNDEAKAAVIKTMIRYKIL